MRGIKFCQKKELQRESQNSSGNPKAFILMRMLLEAAIYMFYREVKRKCASAIIIMLHVSFDLFSNIIISVYSNILWIAFRIYRSLIFFYIGI